MVILSRVHRLYRRVLRSAFLTCRRSRLRNRDFTLIAKDCTGGMLLHELGQKFDTPTINACFRAQDFVKFCREMRYYISCGMTEDEEASREKGYPVGILGDESREVRVWFMHYASFAEAKAKWQERSKRIHWDKVYILMTDGAGCDEALAQEFDALPYEHKVLLTSRTYKNVKCAVSFRIKEENVGAPQLFAFKSKWSFKRVIDDWDYVAFLNS